MDRHGRRGALQALLIFALCFSNCKSFLTLNKAIPPCPHLSCFPPALRGLERPGTASLQAFIL